MKTKVIIVFVIFFPNFLFAKCVGKFANPITDICWNCMFPLKISGATFKDRESLGVPKCDTKNLSSFFKNYQTLETLGEMSGRMTENLDISAMLIQNQSDQKICSCPGFVSGLGIPMGFFEPVRLIDVTHIPYCLVSMGGLSLSDSGRSIGVCDNEKFFYHVHWYIYPLLYIMSILTDFQCLEKLPFDLGYLSEFDPTWSDDSKALILFPEALLFANPISVASCAVDAVSASLKKPLDKMFWCAGSQGTIYPFTGNIAFSNGVVGSAASLIGKFIGKMHRLLLLPGTSGEKGLCEKYLQPIIKKSQYQYQMLFPIAETDSCKKIGQTEFFWQFGKTIPIDGEDFSFLIWRRRDCCSKIETSAKELAETYLAKGITKFLPK